MQPNRKPGLRAVAMAAGAAALLSAWSGAAEARELTYAIGFPPGSMVDKAANAYADYVAEATGSEITVKVFPLSLMNLIETSPGLRDGLTDIGYVLAPYYAAEYAHANFINELNMAGVLREGGGRHSLALTGAVIDYVMTKCPTCREEFEAQNQVFMGGGASADYLLQCTRPVVTLEDIKGRRIRAGAGSFQRFADAMGAVGVQMAANEIFEGLSQGVIDCAMLSAPDMENLVLGEVVTDITLGVPGGIYTSAMANVNLDVWRGLTDEERAVLLRASAVASADMSWTYFESAGKVLKAAGERGIALHEPSDELKQADREFVRSDQKSIAAKYSSDYGVADAPKMAEEFLPLLEKWYGLVEQVSSGDELTELYWNEIYSKVDPATYGME